MTIVIGYWGIPALVTIALFLFAFLYPTCIADFDPLEESWYAFIFLNLSIIVSLVVWCIYFAVT